MKRFFLIIALFLFCVSIFSQKQIVITYSDNGETFTLTKNIWDVDSIVFRELPFLPDTIKPTAVDLGLSVKWADKNIGSSENNTGLYFGWGEKTGTNRSRKYEYFPYENVTSNIINTGYDIAKCHYEELWRMPSQEEIIELISKCESKLVVDSLAHSVNAIFYSCNPINDDGSRDSIVMPLSGYYEGHELIGSEIPSLSYYWSGIIHASDKSKAIALSIKHNGEEGLVVDTVSIERFLGCFVRPVYGVYRLPLSVDLSEAEDIRLNSASLKLFFEGSLDDVTEYGLCYSTHSEEVDLDHAFKINGKPTTNTKTLYLNSLEENTIYYCRAYVISNNDPIFSEKIITFKTKTSFPEPEMVDLGLSVKWASWNVGASSITEYGGYYGWGDPTGKLLSTDSMKKFGPEQYSDIMGTSYDIAATKFGSKWRMPTIKEFEELCDLKWTQHDNYQNSGVNVWLIEAPNGNKLVLPKCGAYYHETGFQYVNFLTSYWTGLISKDSPDEMAVYCNIDKAYTVGISQVKNMLMPIRAVYGDLPEDNQDINSGTGEEDSGGNDSGTGENEGENTGSESENQEDNVPVSPLAGQAIDLGLSVLWSDINIGATTADIYGNYYAWGDVEYSANESEYKKVCSQKTYIYYNPTAINDTIYHNIGTSISGTLHDAARMQWGGKWRMPSYREFNELVENCDIQPYTDEDGVNGYIFTSKIKGYEDKSIFLPCNGMYGEDITYKNSAGYYWTGSLWTSSKDETCAYAFRMTSSPEEFFTSFVQRHKGCAIRPVMSK